MINVFRNKLSLPVRVNQLTKTCQKKSGLRYISQVPDLSWDIRNVMDAVNYCPQSTPLISSASMYPILTIQKAVYLRRV